MFRKRVVLVEPGQDPLAVHTAMRRRSRFGGLELSGSLLLYAALALVAGFAVWWTFFRNGAEAVTPPIESTLTPSLAENTTATPTPTLTATTTPGPTPTATRTPFSLTQLTPAVLERNVPVFVTVTVEVPVEVTRVVVRSGGNTVVTQVVRETVIVVATAEPTDTVEPTEPAPTQTPWIIVVTATPIPAPVVWGPYIVFIPQAEGR